MRKVTSLTLIISGFVELVTSIVLYVIPSGRVAYWADYKLFGLSKTQWGDIHITVGTLFLVMAALHIYYNWRPITAYIKNKAKKLTLFTMSFNIALVLSLYVTVGTLYRVPPMNFVLDLGEYFTSKGNEKYGEPPYGHAELSSLKMFCSKMNIDLVKALELLEQVGIYNKGAGEPIGEMAKNNGITPQQIYNIIKAATVSQEDGEASFPETPAPSFGKKTIQEICTLYNLPIDTVILKIQGAGFTVQEGDTVKEVGLNNESNPMVIFEIIKEVASEAK